MLDARVSSKSSEASSYTIACDQSSRLLAHDQVAASFRVDEWKRIERRIKIHAILDPFTDDGVSASFGCSLSGPLQGMSRSPQVHFLHLVEYSLSRHSRKMS